MLWTYIPNSLGSKSLGNNGLTNWDDVKNPYRSFKAEKGKEKIFYQKLMTSFTTKYWP